jgi:hypothetical protein
MGEGRATQGNSSSNEHLFSLLSLKEISSVSLIARAGKGETKAWDVEEIWTETKKSGGGGVTRY